MATFGATSSIGPAAASFVEGAQATKEQARQEKLTKDQEAMKMYKDLVTEGWKPIDPERGSIDGTAMQVGKMGWLQMPKFGKEQLAQVELKRAQTQLAIAELARQGNLDSQALTKLKIAAQKATNSAQLGQILSNIELQKQKLLTAKESTEQAKLKTQAEALKAKQGIPEGAKWQTGKIGDKTVQGWTWVDKEKGVQFKPATIDGKILEAPRQMPPQAGPAAYKTALNEITMNPDTNVGGSIDMMNQKPGSTRIYIQQFEETGWVDLKRDKYKTYWTEIPVTANGTQYDAPTVIAMWKHLKRNEPKLTLEMFMIRMHKRAGTPTDERFTEVVK